MGDELRHDKRAEAQSDPEDPTQTGARSRSTSHSDQRSHAQMHGTDDSSLGNSGARFDALSSDHQHEISAINEVRRDSQTGWQVRPNLARVSRPSIRPSAFGIPRTSSHPGVLPRDSETVPAKRESVPPARPSAHSIPPRLSQTVRKRMPPRTAPPAVKTDIEELLPISHGVKSLPRPPRLPSFETQQLPLAAAKRFPWASLGVFVVMLAASFLPLTRYRGERQVSAARAADEREQQRVAAAHEEDDLLAFTRPVAAPPPLSAVDRIERAFWGEPAKVREALLQEGERALGSDDARLAESLFGRALEFDGDFDGDDARAEYGLARVRLSQTDLDGAEGWSLAAIRKRPRRAEYRALHAEILQRKGRGPEAQMERALARSLAHFSRGTRSR